MPAGLTFYKDLQRQEEDRTSNLGEAKVIVYEDGGGNKYTLDASSVSGLSGVDDIKLSNLLKAEVKFKYHPSGGEEAETKGLGNIISTLFAAKSTSDSKTVLAEEVAKKPVVEAIFDTVDSTNNKKVAEVKLGGTFATEEALNQKADKNYVDTELAKKADASSVTDKADKNYVDAELAKKADASSVTNKADKNYVDTELAKKADASALGNLVLENGPSAQAVATQLLSDANKDQLGTAILDVKKEVNGTQQPALETDLAGNQILQNAVASNGTLKAALARPAEIAALPALQNAVAGKKVLQDAVAAVPALKTAVATDAGLQTAVKTALVGDSTFANAVAVEVNSNDPKFQGSVREVMSQPVFEIPADDNAPLSWDW